LDSEVKLGAVQSLEHSPTFEWPTQTKANRNVIVIVLAPAPVLARDQRGGPQHQLGVLKGAVKDKPVVLVGALLRALVE